MSLTFLGGNSAPILGAGTTTRIPKWSTSKLLGDSSLLDSIAGGVATLGGTLTTGRTYTLPDANITVAGSASALTSGRVPFATTGGLLTDSAGLSYATTGGGQLTIGTGGTSTTLLKIDSAAGQQKGIGLYAAAVTRWFVASTSTAETGGSLGSNFKIEAYADGNVVIDQPLQIGRAAASAISFGRQLSFNAAAGRVTSFTTSSTVTGATDGTATYNTVGSILGNGLTVSVTIVGGVVTAVSAISPGSLFVVGETATVTGTTGTGTLTLTITGVSSATLTALSSGGFNYTAPTAAGMSSAQNLTFLNSNNSDYGAVFISAGGGTTVAQKTGLYLGGFSGGNKLSITHGTTETVSVTSATTTINSTTASTSTTTGALVVSGGVGVAGQITFDGTTGKSLHVTTGTANAAVATTLGSVGPTGSTAGNPQGWLRISVAGTDRFIPYW